MGKREAIIKLRKYKSLIAEHFDVDKVILFGSYATGSEREDSDIDVAIVVNSIKDDFFVFAPLLWKLKHQVDERIEPVLFLKGKDNSGFLKELISQGIII
jgi:uncharacterized protein